MTIANTERPDPFSAYKLIRDEIVHEDNLMSNRLNWFTASQAFLFTALAIAHTKIEPVLPTRTNDYFFPLVPIVAICSCLLISFSILAGLAALVRWRRLLRECINQCGQTLPNTGPDTYIIIFAWSAPVCLPMVFLTAWTWLLVKGW